MPYAVDTTVNINLDYEQIPGCRLNTHGLRFFSVHPDETGTYVLAQPNSTGVLVRNGQTTNLTTVVNDHPGTQKAITRPLFVRRRL